MTTGNASFIRYGATRPPHSSNNHSTGYKAHQGRTNDGSNGAAIGPLLFSYQGPSQKRLQEMLKKRQRRKQLKHQSKVQRSLSLWSDRASAYVEEIFKRRSSQNASGRSSPRPQRHPPIQSTTDLRIPETAYRSAAVERRARSLTPHRRTNRSRAGTPETKQTVRPESSHHLACVKTRKGGESRKMRSGRLDVGKLTDIRKVGDVEPEVRPRTVIYPKEDSTNQRYEHAEEHHQQKSEDPKEENEGQATPARKTSSAESIGLEGLVMHTS